ncbi:hypothetical protein ScPMuIL_011443 [Solemya velum]
MADYIYKIPDPEDLIPCPYEKAHMVRAKRFQYHLMKCRKNYVGKEFATCPFNARHEMPKPELRYHLSQCPDKAMLEPELRANAKGDDGTLFKGCTDVPAYDAYVVKSNENWDEEIPTYARIGIDPSFYQNKNIHRNVTGLKPSEKKEYYRSLNMTPEERENCVMFPCRNLHKGEEEEKLRRPHNKPQSYLGYQPDIPINPQSTVFAYSLSTLSMAGIGRGQPNPGHGSVSAARPAPGVGRSRGMVRPAMTTPGQPSPAPVPAPAPAVNGTNGYFTMGIGRGRGGMLQGLSNGVDNPTYVMPTVRRPISESIAATVAREAEESDSSRDGRSRSDSPSDDTDPNNVCSTKFENAKKQTKKLKKKLRQIEALEQKMQTLVLTDEEVMLFVVLTEDVIQGVNVVLIDKGLMSFVVLIDKWLMSFVVLIDKGLMSFVVLVDKGLMLF